MRLKLRSLAWRTLQTSLLLLAIILPRVAGAQPPSLVTPVLPEAVMDAPYSANLLIGGTPPPNSVVLKGLPIGLTASHNGSGSVAIRGVASSHGSFNIEITANNSVGQAVFESRLVVYSELERNAQFAGGATYIAVGGGGCAVVDGGLQCWGTEHTKLSQTIPARSGVVSVALGNGHACALVKGGVRCWGSNGNGQLGIGNLRPKTGLVQTIPPGSGVVALAASRNDETCAVLKGGVQCWGRNGREPTETVLRPKQIIPAGTGATAIAMGYNHICAIVEGGLRCWGNNDYDQLGDGTSENQSEPVEIFAAGSNVQAIVAGQNHTCAIIDSGVKCWGHNGFGQVGIGSVDPVQSTPMQVIPAGSHISSLAAGYDHVCAGTADSLWCWGSNFFGALGADGLETSCTLPQKIRLPLGRVQSIGAGFGKTCVIVDGRVVCWGEGDANLYSDYAGAQRTIYPPMQVIESGSKASAVAVGTGYSCAVVNGGLKCWGTNSRGQLGDGTRSRRISPVQIIAENSGVTAVSAANRHACAVMQEGLVCWGEAVNGKLGGYANPIAGVFPPSSNVTGVATGDSHTCAVVDGGAYCWGSNARRQLGNNGINYNDVNQPKLTLPLRSNVTAIAAGAGHSCAIQKDTVLCWGDSGVAGSASSVITIEPTLSLGPDPSLTGVTELGSQPCVHAAEGVRCVFEENQVRTWKQVIPIGNVFDAMVPGYANCAVQDRGITCFPLSGYATSVRGASFAKGSGVTAVGVGRDNACAVVNGGIVCWGYNDTGQLGAPSAFPSDKVFVPLLANRPIISSIEEREGVATNSFIYSEVITVNGLTESVPISILGGSYAIDCRPDNIESVSYVATSGRVANGQTLCLRVTSSKNNGETSQAELAVGNVGSTTNSTFSITTVDYEPVNRYRISISATKGHLLTTDRNEFIALTSPPNIHYVAEGVDHKLYLNLVSKNGQEAVPYYRLYIRSIRQHFWTSDRNEYDILRADLANFSDEGIDGYIFLKAGVANSVPLYRIVLRNSAIHHWTTDENEFNYLTANGWVAEGTPGNVLGVTGYVMPKEW